MVTYLLTLPFTSTQIGLMRTLSVTSEMSATWLAPIAMNRIGPLRAGLWSINWQMLTCGAAVALFCTLPHPTISAAALAIGVILSRVGLWSFDISVQIIVQKGVEPSERGSFSSMEASVQNFFELCSWASTIVFTNSEEFRWPALMSGVAVMVAAVFYASFVRAQRGHLVHWSRCMGEKGGGGQGRNRGVGLNWGSVI